MGVTFYGEVSEYGKKEDLKEWLGNSGASLHITYKNKDMTDIEKCEINVIMGNGQKMKCGLKGSVNKKLKVGETVKLTRFIYITQAVKNILSISRLISKEPRWGVLKKNYHKEKHHQHDTRCKKKKKRNHDVLLEGE